MLLPILYLVSFFDAWSFALLITTMTPYVYSLGGTQFHLGVLGSVTALINLVWIPFAGSLSDTFGRKIVLLQCIFVCAIANILVTCSSSLVVFFVSRILAAFGTPIMILLKSLIDDNIKSKESKMAAINRIQALGGLCFILGGLSGGFLSELENGYSYIFGSISALQSVNFFLLFLVKDTQVKKITTKENPQKFSLFKEVKTAVSKLTNINWPKYWDLFAIKLLVDFVLNVFQFTFAPIVMQGFGITGKLFGYVFASVCVISMVTGLLMTKLKKVFYARDESGLKRLLHGCILLTYVCLGQGLSNSFLLYYIHLIPLAFGRVLYESTCTEVILARASPEEKGSILGAFESTMFLGGLIAPVASGIVSETWGNETCMILCSVPLIIGTVLAYVQKRKVE